MLLEQPQHQLQICFFGFLVTLPEIPELTNCSEGHLEGLFKVNATPEQTKELRTAVDGGLADFKEYLEQHILASVVKALLKELPEPVMTYTLYDAFANAIDLKDDEQRLSIFKYLVQLLPRTHLAFLHVVLAFLNNINKAMLTELGIFVLRTLLTV
jgi:hypothetical protein